ncbi:hypothetical protein FRB99_002386 [Tulasnella sp. 403]|nr:hypothetical protein FRB99_002386 [Tulasnella sp. 403]
MSRTDLEPAIQNALLGFFGDLLHQDISAQPLTSGKARLGDAIENADNKIDRIVDSLQRFQVHAAIGLSRLRRQRNTFVPVHRLPIELLQRIFIEAMIPGHPNAVHHQPLGLPSFDPTYYQRLLRLAGVCSYWSNIISEDARRWTEIGAAYNPSLISIALERSKSLPLSIHCQDSYTRYRTCATRRTEFITRVAPSTDRWTEAVICVERSDELLPLASMAAPQLRSLDLSSRSFTPPTLNLFQNHPPKLDVIRLEGVSLNWTSPIFSGLKELSLQEISVFPSLPSLCNILQACPELTSLQLVPTSTDHHDGDVPADSLPIHLSKLKSLDFTGLSRTATEFLLSRISAPCCNSIVLGLHHGSYRSGDIHGSLSAIFSLILSWWQGRSIQSTPKSGRLEFLPHSVYFGTSSPPGLRLDLMGPRCDHTLHHLVQNLGTLLRHTILAAHFGASIVFPTMLHDLNAFPLLRELGISDLRGDAFVLAEPYVGENGILKWYLPNLRILECRHRDYHYPRPLLGMIRMRAGLDHSFPTGNQELPTALSTLVLAPGSNMDVKTYRQLTELVPKVLWPEAPADVDGDDDVSGDKDTDSALQLL